MKTSIHPRSLNWQSVLKIARLKCIRSTKPSSCSPRRRPITTLSRSSRYGAATRRPRSRPRNRSLPESGRTSRSRQIGSDRSAADAALKTLIDKYANGWAYQIAEVYALRDDAKATFEWLDRAWSNRDPGLTNLLFDPLIARSKGDPRFAAFCRKVGLPVPGEGSAAYAKR
jgi:hypothetical protein